MIKICFVVTIYVTYKCFLKELSEYLHRDGNYDISLICADDEDIAKDIPEYVHYYPVQMKRGVSLSIFKSSREIEKIIKENNFDIVQYSTPNAAFCASTAAKRAKVPTRLYCQWGIRYMGFDGWKRSVFKWIERKTCKNSTFIEAESHNIRNFSIEEGLYGAEKSSVIWNGSACGVNFTRFDINQKSEWRKKIRQELGIDEDAIVFSFAGRITADKGVNELFGAFKSIEEKYSNTKLIVMGGYDDTSSIDGDLLDYAKSSENVIMTGNVNNVEEYYAATDVFVAPSYREGFGLVVVEAESMGVPAIVSEVPGQVDAISDGVTGLSCEVKSTESLTLAMTRLLSDAEAREQMGREAAMFAKNGFDQEILFKKIKAHREELFNANK